MPVGAPGGRAIRALLISHSYVSAELGQGKPTPYCWWLNRRQQGAAVWVANGTRKQAMP